MVAVYVQTVRRFHPRVWFYLIATSLIGFAYDGGIYSVIFNLYLLRLDYGPELVGQVNSVGMLAFAISAFPAGALGERWGNRRMMLVGLTLMGLSSALLAQAEFVALANRPLWLMTTYIVVNCSLAFYFVNSVPFLMNITSADERSAAFSIQSAMISLAAFVGSLVAGFLPGYFAAWLGLPLASPTPYRYPLLLAALLLLGGVWVFGQSRLPVSVAVAKPVALPGAATVKEERVWPLIGAITIVRLLLVGGSAVAMIFFNVYLDAGLNVPTPQVGIAISLGRLLAVPAALLTPLIAARWGNGWVTILASFGMSLFLLPLALLPVWYAAIFGYVGAIAMTSVRYPAFLVYTMDLVPARYRSLTAGSGEMAAGLSFAVVAFAGGYIITAGGYRPLFLAGAAISLLAAVLLTVFWIGQRRRIPEHTPNAA